MPVTYPFGEECFTYGEKERQEDVRAHFMESARYK
jgi:hypothetical protein